MTILDREILSTRALIRDTEALKGRSDPGDGYGNFLTEAEAIVRAPLVSAYRWKLEQLLRLRAAMETDNDNN